MITKWFRMRYVIPIDAGVVGAQDKRTGGGRGAFCER